MFFAGALLAAFAGFTQVQAVSVQAVQVASTNGSLTFSPEKITAEPGSMVQFQFMGGNHTVTQSTFDSPCVPLNQANPQAQTVGIFSGYVPVDASASMGQRPVFTVMVNDTTPMWLYCQQGPHCQRGMAMVINENPVGNSTRTLENYKLAAAAMAGGEAGNGGQPGAGAGAGGQPSGENGNGATPSSPGSEQGQDGGISAANSLFAVPSTLLLAAGAAFFLF